MCGAPIVPAGEA
jgi:hypothetical protein